MENVFLGVILGLIAAVYTLGVYYLGKETAREEDE